MKVLVDLVDTGQVQFFHPIIKRLIADGHTVKVTARDKDLTLHLLDKYEIPYVCISRMGTGLWGLGTELLGRDLRLFNIARRFRPDVMLAQTGVSVCVVGMLLGIDTVVLEEAEHAKLQRMISLPFATRIMTGTGYLHDHGSKQRRFRGIWVQSYLAPDFFVPSKEPLREAGIDPDEPYIVLRTVAWEAAHDMGHRSVDEASLRAAIERLEPYGRVLVSAEKALPESLRSYANPVPSEQVLHLLAFAKLYIGEGGTMAAEAAVLGTPAIFCNPLRCGYLLALETEYDLVYNVPTLAQGTPIAERLLERADLDAQWNRKSRRLWEQTDDIVAFTLTQLQETADRSSENGPDNQTVCSAKHAAASETHLKALGQPWKKLFYLCLLLVVLFFVGRSLWNGVHQLDWSQLHPNYLLIGAAVVCLMTHRLLTGVTFSLLLSSFGERIGLLRAVAIEWATGLGQYVPGKVAAVSGIVALLCQSGVHVSVALAMSVLPIALTVLLGFLFSAPLFVMEPLNESIHGGGVWMIGVVLLCGVMLIPKIFLRNTNFMLRVMRRPRIVCSPDSQKFLAAAGLIVLRFMVLGLGLFLLANAFTPVGWDRYFFLTMVSVASSVAGFLAFFTPAGLGVREGIILLLLGPVLGAGDVAVIVVLLRLCQVLVDLAAGSAGIGFLHQSGFLKSS